MFSLSRGDRHGVDFRGRFETVVLKLFGHLSQFHPPVGDEVAPFSAARQSAQLGRNAFTSPGSFGCGCAALRGIQ